MAKGHPAKSSDQVVRLSFSWIVIGLLAVLLVGLSGGLLAEQVWRRPLPPLTNNSGDRLATTVQEVTISPNTAIAELVERSNRGVVLLGRAEAQTISIVGSGLVITNDGLIVTTTDATNLSGFDYEGRLLPLERVGRDALFGLTYYRVPNNNVVIPLDLRQSDSPVGHELVLLTRNPNTFQAKVQSFRVSEYILPTGAHAIGIQKILQSTPTIEEDSNGSPLLDEEGRVAGVVFNALQGQAIPISHLQASLQRATGDRREFDPFSTLGLSLTYTFQAPGPDKPVQFVAVVSSVAPGSPAAAAGLVRGDSIIKIKDQVLDWQRSVVTDLSAALPFPLTIRRGDSETTVTLPVAAPTTP